MNTIDKEKVAIAESCKTAIANTNDAQRLLNRLCKHFSHKVMVKWENHLGFIEFTMGVCYLEANDASLHFRCEAKNELDLEEIIDTIDSHFKRFADDKDIALIWNKQP